MSDPCPNIEIILKDSFRLSYFRTGQKQIIEALLHGQDVLAILPTGSGKSLCYQLPAIAKSCIVVVISPLISLMKDQVDKLRFLKIPAGTLCSDQTVAESKDVLQQLEKGGPFVLFVSPERIARKGFLPWLKDRNIGLFAIDEAHCLSQWGHDFRPHYRNLSILRDTVPHAPILAVTATATQQIQRDILRELKLRSPLWFRNRKMRDNLYLQIRECVSQEEKILWTRALLANHNLHGRTIIYCGTRRQTEEVSDVLEQDNLPVAFYHGGLSAKERRKAQDNFERGVCPLLVATNAFGMGVDYPNIRRIVHFQVPASLESLDQEIGRAGRDQKPANCVLLYCANDWMLHDFLIKRSAAPKAIREYRYRLLSQAIAYARTPHCRHQVLAQHFGTSEGPCGHHCDICDPQSLRLLVPRQLPPQPPLFGKNTGEGLIAKHSKQNSTANSPDPIAAKPEWGAEAEPSNQFQSLTTEN